MTEFVLVSYADVPLIVKCIEVERVVMRYKTKLGIYFIEVDEHITGKVVKVR